jgi:ABC-2 type transport system ATP-binding protein
MTIIEVHGLVKRYGDDTAVNGVGFTVEQGEIFGFDAGASPAIPRCLSRLQSPQVESTGCAAL